MHVNLPVNYNLWFQLQSVVIYSFESWCYNESDDHIVSLNYPPGSQQDVVRLFGVVIHSDVK